MLLQNSFPVVPNDVTSMRVGTTEPREEDGNLDQVHAQKQWFLFSVLCEPPRYNLRKGVTVLDTCMLAVTGFYQSNEPLWLTDWTSFQPDTQTHLVTNVANFAQNRWLRSAQCPTQPKSYFTGDKHRTKSQNLADPSDFGKTIKMPWMCNFLRSHYFTIPGRKHQRSMKMRWGDDIPRKRYATAPRSDSQGTAWDSLEEDTATKAARRKWRRQEVGSDAIAVAVSAEGKRVGFREECAEGTDERKGQRDSRELRRWRGQEETR